MFDVSLQLPRRLGAVHVDGVLPITDNFPSPVGIFPSGAAASVGNLTSLQELPLDSGPWRTPFSSARPSVLPAAGQGDVVDLDALVDEGGRGVTRDLSIGGFNDCRKYSKGSYDLRTCFFELLETPFQSSR